MVNIELNFSKKIKIGVVGSRRRNTEADYILVRDMLANIIHRFEPEDIIVLVSGGCSRGADSFVNELTEKFNLSKPIIFPADWDKYKKAAGFIRNTDIAKESDILIAVVAADRTGGTEDTVKKFKKFYPQGELILL